MQRSRARFCGFLDGRAQHAVLTPRGFKIKSLIGDRQCQRFETAKQSFRICRRIVLGFAQRQFVRLVVCFACIMVVRLRTLRDLHAACLHQFKFRDQLHVHVVIPPQTQSQTRKGLASAFATVWPTTGRFLGADGIDGTIFNASEWVASLASFKQASLPSSKPRLL